MAEGMTTPEEREQVRVSCSGYLSGPGEITMRLLAERDALTLECARLVDIENQFWRAATELNAIRLELGQTKAEFQPYANLVEALFQRDDAALALARMDGTSALDQINRASRLVQSLQRIYEAAYKKAREEHNKETPPCLGHDKHDWFIDQDESEVCRNCKLTSDLVKRP